MPALNEFLIFGTGPGANVLTQVAYANLAARSTGFSAGIAKSNELNKVWRQASTMASAIAEYIASVSGDDVLDDGVLASKVASFNKALSKTTQNSLAWDNSRDYMPGQLSVKDGTLFVSLTNHIASMPPSANWLPYGNGRLPTNIAGAGGSTLSAIQNTYAILDFTGLLTANSNVIVSGTVPRSWIVTNSTTGNFTLTVKTAAGAGVSVPQGASQMVFTDGADVYPVGVPITNNGVMLLTIAGTAALPGLYFSGDRNTGLFSPGADSIGFATNGVERSRIAADGSMSCVVPGGSTLYPDFACRAWARFSYTAANTGGLNASGNVSSFVRNGVADYTVNFATAMPDVNYAAVLGGTMQASAGNDYVTSLSEFPYQSDIYPANVRTTTSVRIAVPVAQVDVVSGSLAIFR